MREMNVILYIFNIFLSLAYFMCEIKIKNIYLIAKLTCNFKLEINQVVSIHRRFGFIKNAIPEN
jgi:hypothetical protein